MRAVSSFLDQNNSALLGGSPLSSSSSVIYQEELTSSTANIRLINPEHTLKSVSEAESKRRHHGKTDTPLFRLAAVIINQQSSPVGSIEKVELDLWRQAVDANITGAVIAAQKFMPLVMNDDNAYVRFLLLTKWSFAFPFPAFMSHIPPSSPYAFLSIFCTTLLFLDETHIGIGKAQTFTSPHLCLVRDYRQHRIPIPVCHLCQPPCY